MSITTYRVQYNCKEVLDDQGFPLEFLSLAAVEFVVRKLMKLPEYDMPHWWRIVDSRGQVTLVNEKTVELRLIEDLRTVESIFDYLISFVGTRAEIEEYTKKNGYQWKPSKGMLFEGYYVHPASGNCLIPT